jgi:methionyl-tRNA synthetase
MSQNWSPDQFCDQLKKKKAKTFLDFSGRFSLFGQTHQFVFRSVRQR